MKNINFKYSLALACLFSLLAAANSTFAAPVRFEQVRQIINAKPGKANNGSYAQLRLLGDDPVNEAGDDGDKSNSGQKDDRVITETRAEIVEDDACDCPIERVRGGGFPKWAFLGLGAVPLAFLVTRENDTPTPTTTPTGTPTTVSPSPTVSPTPTMSPTPEPVPEPMTILLFGTGLAGIGVAARRRLRKRGEEDEENGK